MSIIDLINEYFEQENDKEKTPINNETTSIRTGIKAVGKIDFINIQKPKYVTFKIIPDMDVENNSNNFIAKAMHGMYKMVSERWEFDKDNIKIKYDELEKFFFDIIICKDKVEFYLTIPQSNIRMIKPTIDNAWSKCSINTVETPKIWSFDLGKTSAGTLSTLKHNYFSLKADKRENTPLSHILENQKTLDDNDKIRINICGCPYNTKEWANKVDEARTLIRDGKLPEKIVFDKRCIIRKGLGGAHEIFEDMYGFASLMIDDDIERGREDSYEFSRNRRHAENQLIGLNQKVDRDDYTQKKQNQDVFDTNIRILVQSESDDKNDMILRSLLNNYNTMTGDNEFMLKKELNVYKVNNDMMSFKKSFNPISNMLLSLDEISKLIMLPTKSLQDEFSMQKIDSREVGVSKALIDKGIIIGHVSHKGKVEHVGFGEDKDSNSKPVVYLGEQGGGKTSSGVIYSIGALKRGETVICPDVADGKLINNVINYLPKDFPEDHIIILDYNNPKYIIPLGWNEINLETLHGREAMAIANALTQQIKYFLDTLSERPLTDKMREYLSNAGRLVFRYNDSTIVDLMKCLTDYDVRHMFIERSGLPETHKLIQSMLSLDTPDKKTRLSTVDGIVDRMGVLLADANLELIMSQKPNLDIDFGKWMNDKSSKYGYFVGVRIPKADFLAETTDTMVTMLVSKVWLATLFSRNKIDEKDRKQAHLILDEPHQYEQVMLFIKGAIKESRKWRLRFVILTHTLDVFSKMKEDLLSAGCSFIMTKTTQKNFNTIEHVVKPFGITDLTSLKQHHALCSINYKNVSHNFIAHLSAPPEIDTKNYKFKDRMYLYNKCAEKYGKEFVWEG